MARPHQYTVGWLDSSIHAVVPTIGEPPASMAYALITCLDSSRDLPLMRETSKHLRQFRGQGELIGRGLLLPTRLLVAAEPRDALFFGYDEVWFFPKPDVSPKPDAFSII